MTDLEKLMYNIMISMSANNITVVFKGALITKLILFENNYSDIYRHTVDLVANWMDNPLPMLNLLDIINQSLLNFNDRYILKLEQCLWMENSSSHLS
jgi:hypothetical protein